MKSPLLQMIIWIFICASAIVGYKFWYSSISTKSITVSNLQKEIDMNTESALRSASARRALAEIAEDESAIQRYFVPETEIVSFINDLEGRGRALNANVRVLSVSADDSNDRQALVLTLSINGTFDAVMRTVGVIEFAPYNLSISELSLAKTEEKIWSANLKILVGSIPPRTDV